MEVILRSNSLDKDIWKYENLSFLVKLNNSILKNNHLTMFNGLLVTFEKIMICTSKDIILDANDIDSLSVRGIINISSYVCRRSNDNTF